MKTYCSCTEETQQPLKHQTHSVLSTTCRNTEIRHSYKHTQQLFHVSAQWPTKCEKVKGQRNVICQRLHFKSSVNRYEQITFLFYHICIFAVSLPKITETDSGLLGNLQPHRKPTTTATDSDVHDQVTQKINSVSKLAVRNIIYRRPERQVSSLSVCRCNTQFGHKKLKCTRSGTN